MTPRRMLPWGDANEFRVPREGMSLPEVARKIGDEYGVALAQLRNLTAAAYGVPLALMPLAWFAGADGVRVCAPCRSAVVDLGTLLRCPDCGAVASKPEEWLS